MRGLSCVRSVVRSCLSSPVAASAAPCSSFSTLRTQSAAALRTLSCLTLSTTSALSRQLQRKCSSQPAGVNSARLVSSSFNTLCSSSRLFSTSTAAQNGPHSIVITLAGPDRPGIVRDLSKRLQELNANIEESRMTILGNDFAVILLVNFPSSEVLPNAVKDALQQLFPDFLVATRSTAAQRAIFASPHRIFTIHVQGPDQPGIVRNLTELLVTYNISVRDLDTDTSSAPFAGYKIFNLKAVIAVPTSVSFTSLHEGLKLFEEKYGFQVEIDDPTQPQQQTGRDDFAYEDESVDEAEEEEEEDEEEYPEEEEEEYQKKDRHAQQNRNHQQQLQQQQKKYIPAAQIQQQPQHHQQQQGGKQQQQQQKQHDLNKTYKDTVRAEKEKKQRR